MIDQSAIDTLFLNARTQNKWKDEPVSEAQLRQIYDILKFGSTSANASPARFIFIRTAEGKEKLKPALSSGNLAKTMSAPVVCIASASRSMVTNTGTFSSGRRSVEPPPGIQAPTTR